MKRSLLIGAVAVAAAGSAMAQSSVTLWGRVNTSAEYQRITYTDGTKDKLKTLENNGSRLGFKGSEDLGGGLKAGFYLEHRFDSDDGTASGDFWAGDSFVSLGGGFGDIRLGRITSGAYYATADYVSLVNHDTGDSADALYYDARGWNAKNRISYLTPDFGGLTGELQVGAGEGEGGQEKSFDLALNYKLGDLALGLGAGKMGDDKQVAIRALYTLGDFAFGGYYQRIDDDTQLDANGLGTLGGGKRNNFRLVGAYYLGASEFHLNFGQAGDWDNVDGSSKSREWTVGYNYNLSKQTKVYAYATQVKHDDGLAALLGYTKAEALAAGIRVNF